MIKERVLEKNSRSAITWGAGGRDYDKISHSISDAIEHCVNRVAPAAGEKILDVATGTGWAARLLANRKAQVTGIDIGYELIAAAEAIALQEGLKINFEVGDAESLAFADENFDVVVSTFGAMFVTDPEAAAKEMTRVCRKGGRLAMATWAPDDTIFGLFKVMKPYQPVHKIVPPSPFAWGSKERITELFGAEFDLKFETGVTYLRERNALEVWNLFVESYGPAKSLAASLDDARREDLKNDFINFHDQYKSELGINMPREYLITIGVKK